MTLTAPSTIHRGAEELPFITFPDGIGMQLVQVDLSVGVYFSKTAAPGDSLVVAVPTGFEPVSPP